MGLDKVRHLDCSLLWLQTNVDRGVIKLHKLKGKLDSVDLGTEDLHSPDMFRCLEQLCVVRLEGRHTLGLECV